jgi:hypothetical protein
MEDEMMYSYFMQECDTAHTPNFSINVLHEVLEDRLISGRLLPEMSPELNPCDFFSVEKL